MSTRYVTHLHHRCRSLEKVKKSTNETVLNRESEEIVQTRLNTEFKNKPKTTLKDISQLVFAKNKLIFSKLYF